MRYELTITETSTRIYTVTIDTDRNIDDICTVIERGDIHCQVQDIWDIRYIDGVKLVSLEEGADEIPDFEIDGCNEVSE